MRSCFHSLALVALFPCLLSGASAVFPKAKWGASAKAVKGQYSGASVEIQPTGETFMRAKMPLFGNLNARTTFSTHPAFGLNVIVTEFPAPGFSPTISASDYPRPTAKQAEGIKASVIRALTGIYGKPSHTKATVHGSITVWKGKEDVARLNTVTIDSGQTDVRLWLDKSSEQCTPTTAQRQLEAVFTHTNPSTWSEGGGMKTKWGMGPADVAEVYPGLESSFLSHAEEPKKEFSTNAFIEGNVGIYFFFYKGRLCQVKVGPFLLSGGPRLTTDTARQEFWDYCQRWAAHAREVLREKYGEPLRAPTPDQEKAAEAMSGGIHRLEWVWRTEETIISIVRATIPVQIIDYQDASPAGRESFEAVKAYEAANEAERKAPF